MSLKMKLTASISAFFLVVGLMLIGIMAVNQATVNMGGSISFTATDVYAHVTGSIANDTSSPSNLDVTYSAEETTGDPTVWNDLSLAFDSKATPIEVKITVENLSQQNTLRVNLNDTLSSTIGNLEKVVKNDGGDYTNQTDITLQPNGQENDSTTFTITMSIIDKNTSLTADFDYELNLFDQYYEEPPQIYEYFNFEIAEDGSNTVKLSSYTGSLTEIEIPSHVTYENGVWMEGDDYTVVGLADAVQFGQYEIGSILRDSVIKKITLPNTFELIDSYSFGYCRNLRIVDLSNCTRLKSIGGWAFLNCSGLTSITLPSSLTSIGNSAFSGCTNLQPSAIDQGVSYLGNSENPYLVLWDGTDITTSSYTVNEKCKIIYYSAFIDCSGLTEVDLSQCTNLTSIGDSAFEGCSGLKSIDLPSSLTSIGEGAFEGCTNLQPSVTDQGVEYLGNSDNPYLVLWDGTGITTSSYTVNEKCKIIYYSAFIDCSGLESITLPSNLTSIGSYAFRNCSGLESITLPSNLTSIGDYAFDGCSGLTGDLVIPEGVTSIGDSAFEGCSGLKSIDLPSSLTSIGSGAFRGCSGLESITLPSNLTSIGDYAFDGCSGLTGDLVIPEGVTSIGMSAFEGCGGLESITLPSSLTSIGLWAFGDCSGLTDIRIEATTPPILGYYAIPSNVTTIEVPSASVDAYKSARGWSSYADEIVGY